MNQTWFKLAVRQLAGSRTFVATFVVNLALGLAGFLALDLHRESFSNYFTKRARSILSADLAIASRRPLTAEEASSVRQVTGANARIVEQSRFLSMVNAGSDSRLCSVIASQPEFPLAGLFSFEDGTTSDRSVDLDSEPNVWLHPEIAIELNVRIGQSIGIGSRKFKVTRIIRDDPTGASGAFEFSPRAYIGLRWLDQTQLIQKGSRVEYRTYVGLPPNSAPASTLQAALKESIVSPEISVLLPVDAASQLGRAFTYLTDYLSLISMVGLFVVLIASIYLLRGYIAAREHEIGILRVVGATPHETIMIFALQTVILGVTALALGCIIAYVVSPIVGKFLAVFLPRDFQMDIPWSRLPGLLATMFLVCLLASLPAIAMAGRVSPLVLLQNPPISISRWTLTLVPLAPSVFAFWGMAVLESRSFRTGSVFCSGLAVAAASAILIGTILGVVLRKSSSLLASFTLRHAIRSVTRAPATSLAAFSVIVIVTTLLAAVPQLRSIVAEDLDDNDAGNTPTLFLFDIQPEQESQLVEQLKHTGATIANMSPMVSARLLAINDQPFMRLESGTVNTREDEESRAMRSRTFNLSWRRQLSASESVVNGTFNSPLSNLPSISLEQRFAERMGLVIGNTMTFEVHGVEVKGQITSLRRVKWRSFQPNFFIQFQPGPLTDAPRTSVAALFAKDSESRLQTQRALVKSFPNISAVDVTRMVTRVNNIINQIARVMTVLAGFSAIAGLFVVYALASYQSRLRQWEMNLMRVLGETASGIATALGTEISIVAGSATLIGCILGIVAAAILNFYVFQATFRISWGPLLMLAGLMYGTSLAIGLWASKQRLRARPIDLLRKADL